MVKGSGCVVPVSQPSEYALNPYLDFICYKPFGETEADTGDVDVSKQLVGDTDTPILARATSE